MERYLSSSRWNGPEVQFEDEPKVDRGIVVGLVLSLSLVLLGIVTSGDALRFINIPALLMVLGGTVGATMVQTSIADLQLGWENFKQILFEERMEPEERIRYLVDLSQRIKQEGRLLLEQEAEGMSDSFLRLGLQITVDGQAGDDIRRILENEARAANERACRAVMVFESMGNYAPAIGLIGTLIGLIQMLGSLSDPSTVGPSMSLALVATLYGAVTANLVFFPIAGKLRAKAHEKFIIKEITIEGLLSIAKDESPIIIEQRLQGFRALAANG